MRIKKCILLLIVSIFIFSISGCKSGIESPEACFTLKIKKADKIIELAEPYIVEVGQVIEFYNCGIADYYSFFSGMPGSVWADYINSADSTNSGMDTNPNGDFSFSYTSPGNYTTTVVLTNRTVKEPHNYKQLNINFAIKVIEPDAK